MTWSALTREHDLWLGGVGAQSNKAQPAPCTLSPVHKRHGPTFRIHTHGKYRGSAGWKPRNLWLDDQTTLCPPCGSLGRQREAQAQTRSQTRQGPPSTPEKCSHTSIIHSTTSTSSVQAKYLGATTIVQRVAPPHVTFVVAECSTPNIHTLAVETYIQ